MKLAARMALATVLSAVLLTSCKIGSDEVLQFNGSAKYVSLAHLPFDEFGAFTIEAWVRQWRGPLICEGEASDPENSIWMSIGDRAKAGTPYESCGWESDNGKKIEAAVGSLRDANWHHIAMVYDGTRQLLFVDGKRVQEQNAPAPARLGATRLFLIGAHEYPRVKKWVFGSGLMRSVRVSQSAVYVVDFKPIEKLKADTSTVLLLDANHRLTDKLLDQSGHHNDATLHDVLVIKTR